MTMKIPALPALALAIGVVPVAVEAQQPQPPPLRVYSDDWTGGRTPARQEWIRPTIINVAVPRLRDLVLRMQALQGTLDTHPIPPHSHSHSHPAREVTVTYCVANCDPSDGEPPEMVTESATVSGVTGQVTARSGFSFSADSGDMTEVSNFVGRDGRTYTIEVTIADTHQSDGTGGGNGNGGGGFGDSGGGFNSDGTSDGGDSGDTSGYTDSAGYGVACFAAGARVVLSDGTTRAVEDVGPGDRLASVGEPAVVVRTYADAELKAWVHGNAGRLLVTASHPVSTTRGFIPAGELRVGDGLRLADGGVLLVETLEVRREARPNFNLETRGHAPYVVDGVVFGSYPSPGSAEPGAG